MNFFIYESMSTQAVWIRSLTYLALFTAFLKHSCNLSSVKGDPSLKKKKKHKQTVTEQQNNLMSPASPGFYVFFGNEKEEGKELFFENIKSNTPIRK